EKRHVIDTALRATQVTQKGSLTEDRDNYIPRPSRGNSNEGLVINYGPPSRQRENERARSALKISSQNGIPLGDIDARFKDMTESDLEYKVAADALRNRQIHLIYQVYASDGGPFQFAEKVRAFGG